MSTQKQKILAQIQKMLTQIQMQDSSCLLSRYEGSHLTEAQSESGGAAQPPSQYSSICPQGNSIIITIIIILIVVIKVIYQTSYIEAPHPVFTIQETEKCITSMCKAVIRIEGKLGDVEGC